MKHKQSTFQVMLVMSLLQYQHVYPAKFCALFEPGSWGGERTLFRMCREMLIQVDQKSDSVRRACLERAVPAQLCKSWRLY